MTCRLQAPVGVAVKRGILGKLWSATEIARKANHSVSCLLMYCSLRICVCADVLFYFRTFLHIVYVKDLIFATGYHSASETEIFLIYSYMQNHRYRCHCGWSSNV